MADHPAKLPALAMGVIYNTITDARDAAENLKVT
jgi:hypothetical protein